MTEAVSLKSLRDRPFELLAELERRGRALSAQVAQETSSGREWVGVAMRMAVLDALSRGLPRDSEDKPRGMA